MNDLPTEERTAQHTPGPWRTVSMQELADSGLLNDPDFDPEAIVVASTVTGEVVADAWRNGEQEIDLAQRANAALIAAAPSLLEICKMTLDYWELTGFADCDDDCDCIVHTMRDVIAQAEGRS